MDEHRLSEEAVCRAVAEISAGLVHANLGGGVYKQRVARSGKGKSGGLRTILFFKSGVRAFFITGFAKNDQENLKPGDLKGLRDLAKELLEYDEKGIGLAVVAGAIEEIRCEESLSKSSA